MDSWNLILWSCITKTTPETKKKTVFLNHIFNIDWAANTKKFPFKNSTNKSVQNGSKTVFLERLTHWCVLVNNQQKWIPERLNLNKVFFKVKQPEICLMCKWVY